MNLPELGIRRPVMTTLLMAGLLVFGLIAYRALPLTPVIYVYLDKLSRLRLRRFSDQALAE